MTWHETLRSRRCDACDVNWPRGTGFDQCPGCGTYTTSSSEPGLDAGPAADLILHLRQERLAAEYESKRKHDAFEAWLAARDEPLVQELITALDLLPTAPAELDHPPQPTTPNYGRAGGELPS